MAINWESVSSSNIDEIGYEESTNTLHVRFLNGSHYAYYNVPQDVYEDLMDASSHGSFLAEEIKGVYQYAKI